MGKTFNRRSIEDRTYALTPEGAAWLQEYAARVPALPAQRVTLFNVVGVNADGTRVSYAGADTILDARDEAQAGVQKYPTTRVETDDGRVLMEFFAYEPTGGAA